MKRVTCALLGLSIFACCCAQTSDYPPEQENALQRTTPGKQLYKEDQPCGGYFWKSEKADKSGAVALYYFCGSQEYGKGKMGMYQQSKYRVVVNDRRDPPTAQVIRDGSGLKEVKIQMTQAEFEASRACFPAR